MECWFPGMAFGVFGNEFKLQADNLQGYRERLEAKGKKVFNGEEFVADFREELDFAVRDIRATVDRAYTTIKSRIADAK